MTVQPQDIWWRLIAFLSGAALVLAVLIPMQSVLGVDSPFVMPFIVASYVIAGAILGFCFHDKAWRTGLWLVAFFLLLVIVGAAFVGSEVPWEWKKEARSLLEDATIVTAAFIGVAIGSFFKRRMSRLSSPTLKGERPTTMGVQF